MAWHSSKRELFIDNLLVRIHFIIEMIRWTSLAPWDFEFRFPGSLTSTFLHRSNIAFRVAEMELEPAAEKVRSIPTLFFSSFILSSLQLIDTKSP